MQEFTAELKRRMKGVRRDTATELVDPNMHNNKLIILGLPSHFLVMGIGQGVLALPTMMLTRNES
jgi:hypothetical protein